MKIIQRIQKSLSANDIGETGSHQAGILIPKSAKVLSFFPELDRNEKNPRQTLYFFEEDGITKWPFEFIYYNNRFFGGTRNEFRLTCMTPYMKSKNAKIGDVIEMLVDEEGRRHIHLHRIDSPCEEEGVLKLRSGWKIISI